MSEQSAKMTYRLSDGTETTYLVELQPESDYSMMDKKFYLAGVQAERERIIKLLEADRNESHAIDNIFDGIVFQTISRAEFKQALIKLIKGETNE